MKKCHVTRGKMITWYGHVIPYHKRYTTCLAWFTDLLLMVFFVFSIQTSRINCISSHRRLVLWNFHWQVRYWGRINERRELSLLCHPCSPSSFEAPWLLKIAPSNHVFTKMYHSLNALYQGCNLWNFFLYFSKVHLHRAHILGQCPYSNYQNTLKISFDAVPTIHYWTRRLAEVKLRTHVAALRAMF